jgi:hypothetical protein
MEGRAHASPKMGINGARSFVSVAELRPPSSDRIIAFYQLAYLQDEQIWRRELREPRPAITSADVRWASQSSALQILQSPRSSQIAVCVDETVPVASGAWHGPVWARASAH